MKSKYQSAVGTDVSSRCNSVGPLRKMCPHIASLAIGEYAPCGDLVERSQAADAQAGRLVDPAYVDARRRHPPACGLVGCMGPHACGLIGQFGRCAAPRGGVIRALRRLGGAHGSGSFAFNARATREAGGRARKSEMN